MEQGRDDEAKEILHALMQQRGFYPMVAAQLWVRSTPSALIKRRVTPARR